MNASLDFSYGEGECAPQFHLRWTPGAPRLVAKLWSGYHGAVPSPDSLPTCDLARLRRIARLGRELDLWDDRAHVWGDDSCCTVDGPFWKLELVVGRRSYLATGCSFGGRFELCRRLLGLRPTSAWSL
jgi:hypothetical protein